MKKLIVITAALLIACIAQAETLTNIASGVDNFGTWITKINAGFAAAEPSAFGLYTTGTVSVAATSNYGSVTVKNWTGSTIAQGMTVSTTNGTAQALTAGIFTLNASGTIAGTGSDTYTLSIYNATSVVPFCSQTFTGTNATAFNFQWLENIAKSNTLSMVITGDTNRLAFLTNACTVISGGTTNTYDHAGVTNSRAIYSLTGTNYPTIYAAASGGTNRWNYSTDSTTTVETVTSAVLWPWQAAWTSISVSAAANTSPTTTDTKFWGVKH
jgi:hypothetical protein